MGTAIITNIDSSGDVCLDARLSNGVKPFFELPVIPGFPTCIDYEDSIEVDTDNFKEILYRRTSRGKWLYALYRIPTSEEGITKAWIYPSGVDVHPEKEKYSCKTPPPLITTQVVQEHFLTSRTEFREYLVTKCGVTSDEIESAVFNLENCGFAEVVMQKKSRVTRGFEIRPVLRTELSKPIDQIYVTLTEEKSGKSATLLFCLCIPTKSNKNSDANRIAVLGKSNRC
jgi:hypothetical protein